MAYRYIRTIGDAERYGLWIDIICPACRREVRVAPTRLLTRFHAGEPLASIGDRMKCQGAVIEGGGCGHRGAIVRAALPDGPPPAGAGEATPVRAPNVLPLRRRASG